MDEEGGEEAGGGNDASGSGTIFVAGEVAPEALEDEQGIIDTDNEDGLAACGLLRMPTRHARASRGDQSLASRVMTCMRALAFWLR